MRILTMLLTSDCNTLSNSAVDPPAASDDCDGPLPSTLARSGIPRDPGPFPASEDELSIESLGAI